MTLLSLDDLVAQVRGAPVRAGSTRVLAIDGPAGSGKSTLAARLASVLRAPVVHMDDLYPGWDGLAAAAPLLRNWIIEPITQGRPVRYQRYDWSRGGYGDWVDLPRTNVLVVEGCGCGSRIIGPYLSMLLWVEAPHEIRFARGIERDGEANRPLWERWARQEDALFEAEHTRERADHRIDGTADAAHDTAGYVVTID
ncbi:MAG TPA: uridine kinase [Jiangellaceae bacterium]